MTRDMNELNGFEMMELKKVLGTSLENADGIEATYAVAFIFKKRDDAAVTYNDVLGMTLKEIQEYMGDDDDEEVAAPFEVVDVPKD